MRRLTALWLALNLGLTGSLLAGCAAMAPGYMPVPPKNESKLKNMQTGGGFDQSGAYSLTDQEQKLDCKHLTGSMTVKIIQMREAPNRPKPSEAAKFGQQAAQQITKTAQQVTSSAGKLSTNVTSHGMDVDADYKRDRARLETMNKQLAEKKCRTFDIDAELKPGNSATPTPVSDAKSGGQKQ